MSDPKINNEKWPGLSTDVVASLPTPAAIAHWARRKPGALAVIDGEMAYSYRVLAGLVVKAVAFLRFRGVQSGMVVGILHEQRLLHLIVMQACEAIGAATMSLGVNHLHSDPGLRQLLKVVCLDDRSEDVMPPHAVVIPAAELAEALSGPQSSDVNLVEIEAVPPGTHIVRIVRTSGTTGTPKLIPVSAAELQERQVMKLYSRAVSGVGGGYLTFYNFTSGAKNALCAFALGEPLMFTDQEQFLRIHDRLPPLTTQMVPALASTLADRCAELGKTARTGCIAVIGARLPPAVSRKLSSCVFTVVQSVYGSNETGRLGHVDADGVVDMMPGVQVRILADDGTECPFGEIGAVAIKVMGMLSGYYADSAPAGHTLRDGWLVTTDVGRMLSAGRFTLLGRSDDMLNIAGLKVAPQPYEERFKTLPGVTDAVMIGVPDKDGIDRLLTILEVPDFEQRPRDVEMFRTMWPENLGKVELVYSKRLPRTESGKVRRGVLRDEWIAIKAGRENAPADVNRRVDRTPIGD